MVRFFVYRQDRPALTDAAWIAIYSPVWMEPVKEIMYNAGCYVKVLLVLGPITLMTTNKPGKSAWSRTWVNNKADTGASFLGFTIHVAPTNSAGMTVTVILMDRPIPRGNQGDHPNGFLE